MTITITMTRQAAETFQAALNYAAAVVEGKADQPHAAKKALEAADWLKWAHGRTQMALDHAANRRQGVQDA